MTDSSVSNTSRSSRFWKEMRNFGVIASYLFVCFLVLELYRSAVLAQHGVQSLTLSVALVKALVIGKFILIGDAVKVGDRITANTVLHRIIWKTLAFWVMLMAFNLLEELIVGWFHHTATAEILGEFFGRSPIVMVAPSLVMLMILIPIICAMEVKRTLGEGALRSLLLARERER